DGRSVRAGPFRAWRDAARAQFHLGTFAHRRHRADDRAGRARTVPRSSARRGLDPAHDACSSVAELVEDDLDARAIGEKRVDVAGIEVATALALQEFHAFLDRPSL